MPYVTGWSNNLHKIEKLIPSYRYFQKNVCHFYAISNYCINPLPIQCIFCLIDFILRNDLGRTFC